MYSAIRFKEIQTIPKVKLYTPDVKIEYMMELRDSIINCIQIQIRTLGVADNKYKILNKDYNGKYITFESGDYNFQSNMMYQIRGRVAVKQDLDTVIEVGPWSDWESFRIEKMPRITHFIKRKPFGGHVIYNKSFNALVKYDQDDNDTLTHYRYTLYNKRAKRNEIYQQGEWKFLKGIPTKGGFITMKNMLPYNGNQRSFTFVYIYSHNDAVKLNVFEEKLGQWKDKSDVIFSIGQQLSKYSDLSFKIDSDTPETIQILCKKKVVSVSFAIRDIPEDTFEITNLEAENIQQPFYDLDPRNTYFYTLEMESAAGLRTVWTSPDFVIDTSAEQVEGTADFTVKNEYNQARNKITIKGLHLQYQENEFINKKTNLNDYAIYRVKKDEILTDTCISTNLKSIEEEDLPIQIARFSVKPTFVDDSDVVIRQVHIPSGGELVFYDDTINIFSEYKYFIMLLTPNSKIQLDYHRDAVYIARGNFDGNYICDHENKFRMMLDESVGTTTFKTSNGSQEPLEFQYPIVSYGQLKYKTGSCHCRIISGEQSLTQMTGNEAGRENFLKNYFIDWLTNKKKKVLQLDNGETLIVNIIDSPSSSTDTSRLDTLDFSWSETAKIETPILEEIFPNNFQDLEKSPENTFYSIET